MSAAETIRPQRDTTITPMRRSLKGTLIVLVLGLMVLLLWQLQFDFRQLKDNQRALNLAVSEQLAKQLGLSMASMAGAGCAVLYATEESSMAAQHERYLDNLRVVFPSLQRLTCLLYTSPSPRD